MKISDFNISGNDIPEKIADKILEFHLNPMNKVQDCVPYTVKPSVKSGFRPFDWEKSHGRSGTSQHCFGQQEDLTVKESEKGATDWTCDDFKDNSEDLLDKMVEYTNYTRFCLYNSFIHADHKPTSSGQRQLFKISNGKWQFIKNI